MDYFVDAPKFNNFIKSSHFINYHSLKFIFNLSYRMKSKTKSFETSQIALRSFHQKFNNENIRLTRLLKLFQKRKKKNYN